MPGSTRADYVPVNTILSIVQVMHFTNSAKLISCAIQPQKVNKPLKRTRIQTRLVVLRTLQRFTKMELFPLTMRLVGVTGVTTV